MRKVIVILLVFLFVASCTPSPYAMKEAVGLTLTALSTETSQLLSTSSLAVTPTLKPFKTSSLPNTPKPTLTPIIISTEKISSAIAKNYVASDEDNGIQVEVVRIEIANKEGYSFPPYLLVGNTTLVKFHFQIKNNTSNVISINFYTSIASVNGEQIYFSDYFGDDDTWFGDDLNKDILPGSTVNGGLWTGIRQTTWDEVNKIIISIPHAFNSGYSRVSKDFLLTIEVADWVYEPFPESFNN